MDGLETTGNVGEGGMRDFVGGLRPEPIAPSLSPAGTGNGKGNENAIVRPVKKAKIFAADLPHGEDALGIEASLQALAELASHRDTEAPLTIGLLGGSGSGKSFALAKLLARIEALSGTGLEPADAAFVNPIATLKIDALELSSELPAVALASALYDALAGGFPELAREAAHAVRDPRVVAREAAEQLDISRRRLDTERQNLAEIESRRARLIDTILFEQPGSQIDAYARANRAKIESRLEGFGITGDAIQNYKSMLRDIVESGGASARTGAALRSFWAFKGQTRLLVTAVILILIGLGCDVASAHQAVLLGWLHGANQAFAPTAAWFTANVAWLAVVKQIAFAGAALAVATNLWRGGRFARPFFRGVKLLEAEVASRRQDLDGLYAHQMRRVDALAADVELISRRAAEADRRAANAGVARVDSHAEPSPFATLTPQSQAEHFFVAVSGAIQRGWRAGMPVSAVPLPQRILVALDNVDCLPQSKASNLLDAARRAFDHAGFITLIAADPVRLAAALPADTGQNHRAALEKWLQVPFRIGSGLDDKHYAALVEHALGRPDPALTDDARPKSNPVALDWSVSMEESSLLTALAPLAGQSPRAVKRFINLYRIARPQAPQDKAILSFMLALDQGGSPAEITVVETALATGEPGAAFVIEQGGPRLDTALARVWMNHHVTVEAARRAAAIAQTFSLRGEREQGVKT